MIGMIPWVAILKHAPAILAAADALRARATKNDAGDRTLGVEARLAELEGESRAAAQLTQDLAQQINALVVAHQRALRMARQSFALGITAFVVALAAVVFAVTR